MGRLGALLGASWAVLGASWGHPVPSRRPLGDVLGRLEGELGPLGGQDPTEAKGPRVLETSWGRLGLIIGRFLGRFRDEISIIQDPEVWFLNFSRSRGSVFEISDHGLPSGSLWSGLGVILRRSWGSLGVVVDYPGSFPGF